MRAALAATLISLAGPALASDFSLAQPLDCTLGQTCYIQQYVDHDPGPGAQDFQCAGLSYDGHKGTDFGVPTLADMQAGVDVLAAASGTVRGLRDGMTDKEYTTEMAAEIDGRDCGNGVVLVHEGGWETQYCHMKQGSVQVRKGDTVSEGTVLGQVGLSGRTQFPHMHLSVRHMGKVVDPFDPDGILNCETESGDSKTLWRNPPKYIAGDVLDVGFTIKVPDFDSVKAGTAGQPDVPADAPALVFFSYAFGGQQGDVIELEVTGPDGQIISNTSQLERDQAQYFRAAGKRLRTVRWPAGDYLGTVRILRDGRQISTQSHSFTLR
jgi:hypothetical protein